MNTAVRTLILTLVPVFFANCAAKNGPFDRQDLKTSTISVIQTGPSYYFPGITGRDLKTGEYPEGMTAQTRMVMDKFKMALDELGLDWNNAVKMNVYITDMKEKSKMNEAYFSYFEGYERPSRVCIEAGLEGDALVEMDMIAVKTAK